MQAYLGAPSAGLLESPPLLKDTHFFPDRLFFPQFLTHPRVMCSFIHQFLYPWAFCNVSGTVAGTRDPGVRNKQGMVLDLVKLRFSHGSTNPKQKLKKRSDLKNSMNCYQVLEKRSTFCLDFSECYLLPPIPAQELSPWRQRTLPALSSLNSVPQVLLTHNYKLTLSCTLFPPLILLPNRL